MIQTNPVAAIAASQSNRGLSSNPTAEGGMDGFMALFNQMLTAGGKDGTLSVTGAVAGAATDPASTGDVPDFSLRLMALALNGGGSLGGVLQGVDTPNVGQLMGLPGQTSEAVEEGLPYVAGESLPGALDESVTVGLPNDAADTERMLTVALPDELRTDLIAPFADVTQIMGLMKTVSGPHADNSEALITEDPAANPGMAGLLNGVAVVSEQMRVGTSDLASLTTRTTAQTLTEGLVTGRKLPSGVAVLAERQEALMAKMADMQLVDPILMETMTGDGGTGNFTSLFRSDSSLANDSATQAGDFSLPSDVDPASLAQVMNNPSGSSGKDNVMVLSMRSAMGTSGWQQEFGDKLVWMTGKQNQMAEMILNPPSLGAVEVRLNLVGGEASAQFYSANANVRDAIEASLPRLRELMQDAGIALGNTTVSDQSFNQQEKQNARASASQFGRASISMNSSEDHASTTLNQTSRTSLLDYFA